jgi:hypothetical protein
MLAQINKGKGVVTINKQHQVKQDRQGRCPEDVMAVALLMCGSINMGIA